MGIKPEGEFVKTEYVRQSRPRYAKKHQEALLARACPTPGVAFRGRGEADIEPSEKEAQNAIQRPGQRKQNNGPRGGHSCDRQL